MIKNEKQYLITKGKLKEFEGMLIDLQTNKNADAIYQRVQEEAVKSQILKFKEELSEYESLKSGEVSHIFVHSLTGIQEALIKARIIRGWTQGDLAERMELKEQQIQRYELSDYSTASVARIAEVASALDIDFETIKVKVKEPDLILPEGLINENLLKVRERRALLPL